MDFWHFKDQWQKNSKVFKKNMKIFLDDFTIYTDMETHLQKLIFVFLEV
jgi:hypothetical protein